MSRNKLHAIYRHATQIMITRTILQIVRYTSHRENVSKRMMLMHLLLYFHISILKKKWKPESDNNNIQDIVYSVIDTDAKIIPRLPQKLAIFCTALPKCPPLTISFNTVGQKWNKIRCPCSKIMLGWWAILNKCDICDINVAPYRNSMYTRALIIDYIKDKWHVIHHHALMHYFAILYCNKDRQLQPCISN